MTPTRVAGQRTARRSTRAAPPLAVVGPTAAGKTEASIELARRLWAEVVVIDSMTVYRGMDVGTAKPTAEERAAVRHHLVDVADPGEPFSAARFQQLAGQALAAIEERGHVPLLVGGSGLYFRALVDELSFPGTEPAVRLTLEAEAAALGPAPLYERLADLDPAAAAKIEPANVRRTVRALEVAAITGRLFSSFATAWERYPEGRVRAAGVTLPASALHPRIESRVRAMFDGRLLEEARELLKRGFRSFLTSSQAIGYLEAVELLEGRLGPDEAAARTVRRTKDLARRQMAWFRRDPRIRWFPAGQGGAAEVVDAMEEHLRG